MVWGSRCLLVVLFLAALTSSTATRLSGSLTQSTRESRRLRRSFVPTAACPISAFSTQGYWGGKVMVDGINLYVILYGNWSTTSCAPTVLKGLTESLSNASLAKSKTPTIYSWWKVVTAYCDGVGRHITQQVKSTFVYDSYSQGKKLVGRFTPQPNGVWKVVQYNLAKGRVKLDPNGIYLVLTSGDVSVGAAVCDGYCAWHAYGTYGKTDIPYAWVADPTTSTSCSGCITNLAKTGPRGKPYSPNGCYAADSMASSILHELAEAATNPLYTGWDSTNFRPLSHEVADVCDSNSVPYMGLTWDAKKTYQYNVLGSGSLRFLVQSIYDPLKADCGLRP